MTKRTAQKTFNMVVQHVVDSLDRAAGDDENLDHLQDTCEKEGHVIDTSALASARLLAHPKVKKAFKKFISDTIGNFQYMEEGQDDGDNSFH